MALFSKKPKIETTDTKKVTKTSTATSTKVTKVSKTVKGAETKVVAIPAAGSAGSILRKDSLQGVLMRPRITEKATILAEKSNVYVFEVHQNASKPIIDKTVRSLYKVSPVKIAIVINPSKKIMVRGRVGRKAGVKKAYVYLKKGEKIDFV